MPRRPALAWPPIYTPSPDRLPFSPIREERLLTAGSYNGDTGLALTAWRGRSARRYVVNILSLQAAAPADLADPNAVVLFVGRASDGHASLVSGARSLCLFDAEHRLERAECDGTTEIHLHRITETGCREAILRDLGVAVAEWA